MARQQLPRHEQSRPVMKNDSAMARVPAVAFAAHTRHEVICATESPPCVNVVLGPLIAGLGRSPAQKTSTARSSEGGKVLKNFSSARNTESPADRRWTAGSNPERPHNPGNGTTASPIRARRRKLRTRPRSSLRVTAPVPAPTRPYAQEQTKGTTPPGKKGWLAAGDCALFPPRPGKRLPDLSCA
jgi:hypothetical protein